jgi:hypothetical protein
VGAGPFWMGEKNVAPTGIRTSDRPARSESLYRLHYPSPLLITKNYSVSDWYVSLNYTGNMTLSGLEVGWDNCATRPFDCMIRALRLWG